MRFGGRGGGLIKYSVLKVVLYPEKVLLQKAAKVERVDEELTKKTAEIIDYLKNNAIGAGLAAPQIGISKRYFGIKNEGKVNVYINPEIIATYGEKVFPKIVDDNGVKEDFLEGCFSFPDYWGTAKRYLRIDVVWEELEDGKLNKKNKSMEGFEAIVFQHEFDHLEGIMFTDRVAEDGGKFYKWNGKKMIKWSVGKVIGGEL